MVLQVAMSIDVCCVAACCRAIFRETRARAEKVGPQRMERLNRKRLPILLPCWSRTYSFHETIFDCCEDHCGRNPPR